MTDSTQDAPNEEHLIPFNAERYRQAQAQLARINALIEEAQSLKDNGLITQNDITTMENTKKESELILRLMEKKVKLPS